MSSIDYSAAISKQLPSVATCAIIVCDEPLTIQYWSPQAEDIFGRQKMEVLGKNFQELNIVDAESEFFFAQLKKFPRSSKSISFEAGANAKEGELLHCLWYFSQLPFENAADDSILILVHDITKEVKKQEALKQLAERFSLITNFTNDGIWEWDVVHNSVWANETFQKTFGYNPSDYPDYYNEFLNRMHFDDRNAFLESILSARERKEPFWSGEFRFLLADNTYANIFERCHFIYNEKGEAIKVVGSMLNITKQINVSRELIQHQKELELIYNSVADIIFLLEVQIDNRFRFISVNQNFEKATGFPIKNVIGKYVDEIIPEPSLSIVLNEYKQAIDTKQSRQWEEVTSYPTGKKTGVVTITPVYDESGNCIRLVGSVNDVSDKKKADEALQQSYNEIRSLASHLQDIREEERKFVAAEIHDELGQTLTALKMELAWLRKIHKISKLDVDKRVYSAMEMLDNAITKVRNISTQLHPSILDDLGLIEALKWMCQDFKKRTGIVTSLKKKVEYINVDKNIAIAFFRIYQEALTNVARHADATKVRTKLSFEKDILKLEISDNGKGFDTDKIKGKRTLGLLSMKERMAAIEGSFEIRSDMSKGTTIRLEAKLK